MQQVLILLLIVFFGFSEITLKSFLYSLCLLNFFEERKKMLLLGLGSIIFDIFYNYFVGISFFQFVFLGFFIKKYYPILESLSLPVRIYYSFLILSSVELISYVFIILCKGSFDFYSHFFIVMETMIFYSIFEIYKEHNYAKR